MNKEELFNKLELLGLPLLKTSFELDAHEVLAEVVKSNNVRLWEAFPLLLANSFRKDSVKLEELEKRLKKTSDKARLRSLVNLSCAVYRTLKLKFDWEGDLKKSPFYDQKLFNYLSECLKTEQPLGRYLKKVSGKRVLHMFKTYFLTTAEVEAYALTREDFALEYALSQLFSKKQKELFMKKLKHEKLTKTEREYYSRTVKKKVLALANETLHKLALQLSKE